MENTPVGSNALGLEVLHRHNYKNWRLRVETYLLAEDLWEVIEATEPTEFEDNQQAQYKAWRRNNAKALYAIQSSCGDDVFRYIEQIRTAKGAWEALELQLIKKQGYDKNNPDHLQRYRRFKDSVNRGDWDEAKQCLGDVDIRSVVAGIEEEDDPLPLHAASKEGHMHIVKELVGLMTDDEINRRYSGRTALHIAAGCGHVNVVKVLPVGLLGGEKDDVGNTALHIAVQEGKVDVVKELVVLMRQEDLKIKNDVGYTALHLAVNNGNVPMIKEFVRKEEDDYSMDRDELNISFWSYVRNGDWGKAYECLGELDDPCKTIVARIQSQDVSRGGTALHLAAMSGHVDGIKALVLMLKRREEKLELKTVEDFMSFGCGVNVDMDEAVVLKKAKYMVEQYERTLGTVGSVLDIQTSFNMTVLHHAVQEGVTDIVKELAPLMRQEGLELKQNDGTTALHMAVLDNNVDIVEELVPLMRKEGLEIQDSYGNTALHCALSRGGNVDIMKLLVQSMRQEGLEIQDSDGETALHLALSGNWNVDILKELVPLMRKEGLEIQDSYGNTALHCALSGGGNVDIMKLLVQSMRQEGLEIQDSDGETALHLALSGNWNVDILKELVPLMRKEGLEIQDSYGNTALHCALSGGGNVDIIKLLVQSMRTEGLEIQDSYGNTALHLALSNALSKSGFVDIMKLLIQSMRKEGLEIQDSYGNTALHCALSRGGNVDIMKLLVQSMRQEGLEIQDSDGETALHLALSGNWNVDILKELVPLMRKEGLEIQDSYGNTALHYALSRGGNVDIMKLLIQSMRQEGLEIQDSDGKTALHLALSMGALHCALSMGRNMDIMKLLVQSMRQEGLEIQDNHGNTALHHALSGGGNVDIIKLLIQSMRKEGLEIQDSDGYTYLHRVLLKSENVDIMKFLKSENVDIMKLLVRSMRQECLEVKDNSGSNALHLAIMNEHTHIVTELMSSMRPKSLGEKDGQGYTALSLAIRCLKDEVILEIVEYMAENNDEVFGIPTAPDDHIPVVEALRWNKWKSARRIRSFSSFYLKGPQGIEFLCYCLNAGKLMDLVLDLYRDIPIVVTTYIGTKDFPMLRLAHMSYAFLNGGQLTWWQRWIYHCIHTGEVAHVNSGDISINVSQSEDDQANNRGFISSVFNLFGRLTKGLLKISGFDQIYEMNSTRQQIIAFLRCMIKASKGLDFTADVERSIFKDMRQGHFEFVAHILKENPGLLDQLNGQAGKGIFHLAIETRNVEIYNLIHGLEEKKRHAIGLRVVKGDNNLLHYAANLSSLPQSGHVLDTSLQMQRELQWFKEVGSVVPSGMHVHRNRSDDMTARELFTKNHKKLMEDAESSIKGIATSCTVVGALIVTMMFAAAFTVPGGSEATIGLTLFKIFIVSDTISLASSTSSVITFLGILTSRYTEDDFLKSLPTKMMIGLITLFFSITSMMIAFSCVIIVMLDREAWIVTLSILCTSIPVILFIWLLFPLLKKTFMSTYGPGIFEKTPITKKSNGDLRVNHTGN